MKRLMAVCLALLMFSGISVSASAAAQVAAIMYHEVTMDENRYGDLGISP